MTLERSLRISVLTLAGAGIAALSLAVASAAWTLIGIGLFAACVVSGALWPAWRLRPGLATLAVVAAAQGLVAEVVGTDALLVPAAHFLLLTQLVLLTQERTRRNGGLVCVLSLVHMVLAGVLSADITFGLCFLVYVPAAVAALLLLNLRAELERNGLAAAGGQGAARVRRRLWGSVACVTVLELALTIVVFLYFPRFGLQLFQLRPLPRGPGLTGFSDRVHLGDLERILENAQPVMSARVLQDGRPVEATLFPLRWRGISHDMYEDAAWSTTGYLSDASYQPLHPERGFRPLVRPCPGTDVTQEITLEPVTSRVLFYLPHMLALNAATPNLDAVFWHYPSRTASAPRSSVASLRYVVTSRIPAWGVRQLREPVPLGTELRKRLESCLRLPPSITPRVRALAEQVVAGMPEDAFFDRAKAVESYLKGQYEYSLRGDLAPAGVDPVEDFLFRRQRGHCEHFASAMAILLRTLGIPTRLVTGFHGGEWNEYGRFYIIRQRDAHAWVEVYLPSIRAWEAFDPTPLALATPPRAEGWLAQLDRRFAHLRLVWNAYVVNYSSQEQTELARAANYLLSRLAAIPSWGSRLFALEPGGSSGVGALVAAGAVCLILGVAVVLGYRLVRRRRGHRGRAVAGRPAVSFYRRMEAILRRRGFRREPSATPLEFAGAVVARGGERYAPVLGVARAFCRVRYGARRLSGEERAEIAQALAALERDTR